ncbi:hypothetical protein BDN71DRAFT_1455842 [Pleurotus eryngii]|uniref:Uncharacterized protein n=1 Tax=Pleurotus eryngii TaxID=5323 RepID=A0A9P5ZLI8_PLEER|nr:hypothetical protein BDN71DRAFT_1455842 [Pleurotus eryngii]
MEYDRGMSATVRAPLVKELKVSVSAPELCLYAHHNLTILACLGNYSKHGPSPTYPIPPVSTGYNT